MDQRQFHLFNLVKETRANKQKKTLKLGMMSSNEKVKFRSIPNQESDRPLSTYDNLNNGDTKTNGSTTATSVTSENECENANEFPFTGISFRFDELKQLQQQQQQPNTAPIIHTSNGYDNVTNNNYKLHRSSNGNSTNNNHHNHSHNDHQATHGDSTHFNGNGVSQMRNSQGHNIVTTIAQNHSSSAPLSPSPTSSASSSNSSSAASSSSSSLSENNYKQSSLQYSNLAENPIANRSFSKPVHSPAKSQFLGLHKPSNEIEYATETDGKVTNGGGAVKKPNSEKNALDEVDAISDEEPLLSNYGNNRIRVMANGGPNTSQYQNVPSNSSCYGQNQIDNANECTCTCKSSDSTNEIQQYESDRYKCNGCLTQQQQQRSSANAPISVIPIATMNVPSCSKAVDLSSCSTSMKPAKSTPLDTSPSFRMNQSPLSQVKTTFIIVLVVQLN